MRCLAPIAALSLLSPMACTKRAAEQSPSGERAPLATIDASLPARQIDAPKPWSDAWLLAEGQRYLHDASLRREVLEASLTNPDNIYSRTRLSGYGIAGQGWEMLPVWTPTTTAIDSAYVDALRAGAPLRSSEHARALWDGIEPATMSAWIALGRRVFYEYPLRGEIFAEHALRSPEVAKRVGLQADKDGLWPGVVAFETPDGGTEIGITCALCHVAIKEGVMVEGAARRDFDYGEMRLAFYRDTGAFLEEDTKARMASWGPGRADITQDEAEDPVAIVDLWGVRDHSYLTQSGTIRQVHPVALAIRQETQLLHANHERVRPPRELTWALAMYVYSLTPPRRNDAVQEQGPRVERGREIFATSCQHCHRDKSYAGVPVSAAEIGTDQMLAMGKARGTGMYRPSPLLGLLDAAPYLHDGSVATLDELMDPRRKQAGHRYGLGLPLIDRQALLAYLATL